MKVDSNFLLIVFQTQLMDWSPWKKWETKANQVAWHWENAKFLFLCIEGYLLKSVNIDVKLPHN